MGHLMEAAAQPRQSLTTKAKLQIYRNLITTKTRPQPQLRSGMPTPQIEQLERPEPLQEVLKHDRDDCMPCRIMGKPST